MDNNLKERKNVRFIMIDSSLKGHKEFLVTYEYNGKLLKDIVFVKEAPRYTNKDYLAMAKKRFNDKSPIKSAKAKSPLGLKIALVCTSLATVSLAGVLAWKLWPVTPINPAKTVDKSEVIFDPNGGVWADGSSSVKTVTVDTGTPVDPITEIPTRGNDHFVYWTIVRDSNVQYNFFDNVDEKTVYLYAYYTPGEVGPEVVFDSGTIGCTFDSDIHLEKDKECTVTLTAMDGFKLRDSLNYLFDGVEYIDSSAYKYEVNSDKTSATLTFTPRGDVYVKAFADRTDGEPSVQFHVNAPTTLDNVGAAVGNYIKFNCTTDAKENALSFKINDIDVSSESITITQVGSEKRYECNINVGNGSDVTLKIYGNLNSINFAEIDNTFYDGGAFEDTYGMKYFTKYNAYIDEVCLNQDLGEPKYMSTFGGSYSESMFGGGTYSHLKKISVNNVSILPPYLFYLTPNLLGIELGEGLREISHYSFYFKESVTNAAAPTKIYMKLPNTLRKVETHGICGFRNEDDCEIVLFTEQESFPETFEPFWCWGPTLNCIYNLSLEEGIDIEEHYDSDFYYSYYLNNANEAFLVSYLDGEVTNKTFVVPDTLDTHPVVYVAPQVSRFISSSTIVNTIKIGKNVQTIRDNAFNMNPLPLSMQGHPLTDYVNKIDFGENSKVKEIGCNAFFGSRLILVDNLTIPASVRSIGDSAFCMNESAEGMDLVDIVFDKDGDGINHLNYISSYAFSGCGFNNFELPENVNNLLSNALTGLYINGELSVDAKNERYSSSENHSAIIETKTSTIVKGLGKFPIPDGAKIVGMHAYENDQFFSEETALIIPNSVEVISDFAFLETNIPGLSFQENSKLTYIGEMAFGYNYFLTGDIVLPETVTYIGRSCFTNDSGVNALTLPNSLLTNGAYVGIAICEGWESSQTVYVPFKQNDPLPDGWDENYLYLEWSSNRPTVIYTDSGTDK